MTPVAVPDIASVITVTVPTTSPHTRRGEQLFAAHHVALRRHVRRRDPSLADDVVSETFAIAWRKLDEIPADREFPWLCVTADNVLRNQWRGQRRAHALSEALEWVTPGTTDRPAEPPVVGEALRELPERERALLTMTSFEGLSAIEAADRLGIAHGTARNALVSGRRQLAARLAALGVVVASIVFAIVFVAGRPAAGDRARAQIIDELRHAEGMRQVATVTGDDGRQREYEIHTDTRTGEQRVTLPDGRTARSTGGDELTVVPRRGESPQRTSELQRRYADDLSVLEVATPEQIAELVETARRADSAPAGPKIDGRETTVVRGTITDPAGREREVELLITVDEPEVVRMRTRLAVPGAKWVTVDFSEWEAVSRRSLAATAKAPAPERSDAAALTPSPLERVGGDAQVVSIRDAGPSTPDAADPAPETGDGEPGSDEPEATTPPLTLPAAYDGPTGRILHTRTVRGVTGGMDQFVEAWIELGAGNRVKYVNTVGAGPGDAIVNTTWLAPGFSFLTSRGPVVSEPSLRLSCTSPVPIDVKEAMGVVEAIGVARTALAAGEPYGQPGAPYRARNPDGTLGAEQPTVLVQAPTFGGGTTMIQLTLVAATGEVVQQQVVGGKVAPLPPIEFAVWEVLPEGGPSTPVVEPIPDGLQPKPCRR